MAACNQCGNKLKPGEITTCAECLTVLQINRRKIERVVNRPADSRDKKCGR